MLIDVTVKRFALLGFINEFNTPPKVGRSGERPTVAENRTVECNGIVTGISVTLNLKFKVTKSFVTTLPFI